MLVEFRTVRGNLKENSKKEKDSIMGMPVEFDGEHDYITTIVIELNNIVGFNGGKTYFNGKELDCVYISDKDGNDWPNLLITYDFFKELYELNHEVVIKKWEEILINKQ